jgi:hypothetical protein
MDAVADPLPGTLAEALKLYVTAEVAKATGVSVWAVQDWKSGKTFPRPESWVALARFLRVDVSVIGGWAAEQARGA